MRLWHKDLIKVLPREQLIAQWRELSAIAGAIDKKGTPNHLLVNKVLKYDYNHFISYSFYIREELTNRGYKTMNKVWDKICLLNNDYNIIPIKDIYPEWHNLRYLKQCYHNLEEKYDCGGVTEDNFKKITELFNLLNN